VIYIIGRAIRILCLGADVAVFTRAAYVAIFVSYTRAKLRHP
jgi:hypothetical protein